MTALFCTQVLDYAYVKSLLSNAKTLRQILEEAMSLLKMFWRAALPSTDPAIQNLKKVWTAHRGIRRLVRSLCCDVIYECLHVCAGAVYAGRDSVPETAYVRAGGGS